MDAVPLSLHREGRKPPKPQSLFPRHSKEWADNYEECSQTLSLFERVFVWAGAEVSIHYMGSKFND